MERCAASRVLEALEDQAREDLSGPLDRLPSGSDLGVAFDEPRTASGTAVRGL